MDVESYRRLAVRAAGEKLTARGYRVYRAPLYQLSTGPNKALTMAEKPFNDIFPPFHSNKDQMQLIQV